jgi:hypothetical protein
LQRWLIWGAVVIVWTAVLEFPVPDPGDIPEREFILSMKYVVGKTLHVTAYAALAALSAWVPMPARYRFLMMFFVMAHAWGTEMLQVLLNPWCHRGGELRDVGIDIAGIAIGTAATWKRWTS